MRKLIVAVFVCAACTRGHRDRTGFDALATVPAAKPQPLRSPLLRADVKQHLDERLGIPTFLQAVPRQAGPDLVAAEAAREHLATFAPLYGMTSDQAMSAYLRAVHDTGRGAIIARFGQSIAGVDVFRDEVRVVMDRQKRVIALSGYLAREAAGATPGAFKRGERDAVASALAELGAATTVRDLGPRDGGYFAYVLDGGSARAKRVFFHLPGNLEPAHYVEVSLPGTKPTYQSFVFSATDGRLLFQNDLVFYDQFTYRVWADTTKVPFPGPQGRGGSPHPTGLLDSFQAPFFAPVDVTLANFPFSKNDPWLPVGSAASVSTQTVGNNADAYVDLRAPDGLSTGDFRATVTAPGVFGHTYDTTVSPDASNEQRMAAIQQLFYDVNFFHDWYYDAGFDEASGNAQQDNLGRGGLGGDRLLAEAQDFSGRDNSNMATPADGEPPRMQMFIFNANPVVAVQIQAPQDIAGNHEAAPAQFGPQAFTTPGNLVEAGAVCGPFNPAAVTGNIALIDRGTCTFAAKVAAAQAAGAIGVVIVNNVPGLAGMGGTDATITIPSVMIRQEFGATLHQRVAAGVSLTLLREPGHPDRDGTIDNQIVAHEWGHMIQNRLIGNANGLTNVVGRGMAEGWADFHTLLMTVKAEDAAVNANFNGVYAIAGYTSSGGTNQGYYFGVRRVPYSTDFSKNSLRFRHIADGAPPPTDPNGQPIPVAFWSVDDASTGGNSEFHNTGEVWASMLWECYAALLRDTTGANPRLTFDEAQTTMKDYLVAAYKATPVLPTMLEARDALLSVVTDPQDYELFVRAFAKRGAGSDATGPDRFSADNVGVVEGTVGANGEAGVQIVSVPADDSTSALCGPADGALGTGEAGVLHVVVKSVGAGGLRGPMIAVTSSEPALRFPQGATAQRNSLAPSGTETVDVPISFAAGTSGVRTPVLQVSVADTALGGRVRMATFVVPFNFQVAANQSDTDDVEGPPQWTTGGEKDGFHIVQDDVSVNSHHWSSPDPGLQGSRFLLSPPLQVGPGNFTITFSHRYAFFEGLLTNGTAVGVDGGVVEVSSDGTTFTDFSTDPTQYPGPIFAARFGNPLEGRNAFIGQSDTYPAFITTTLDAGARFAGQTVRVRFLIGSADFEGVSAFGWDIDDIAFGGLAQLPFSKRAGLRGTGCNRAPVALARGPSTGAQHTTVTFDGSGSSDPDGDGIHARWVQLSGPPATFDPTKLSPSVTLPRIQSDTTLAFNLFVDDGLLVGAPSIVSLSAPGVNAKPVANAGPNRRVGPNTQVELDGSGSSDPDDDTLTYQWSQVAGPGVVLAQSTAANPTFVAPASGAVVLQLVVSDGLLSSDPARVTIQAGGGGGCGCTSSPDLGSIVPALAFFAFVIGRRRRR